MHVHLKLETETKKKSKKITNFRLQRDVANCVEIGEYSSLKALPQAAGQQTRTYSDEKNDVTHRARCPRRVEATNELERLTIFSSSRSPAALIKHEQKYHSRQMEYLKRKYSMTSTKAAESRR